MIGIPLASVRQMHRLEMRLAAVFAYPLHGELGQPSADRRIQPARAGVAVRRPATPRIDADAVRYETVRGA